LPRERFDFLTRAPTTGAASTAILILMGDRILRRGSVAALIQAFENVVDEEQRETMRYSYLVPTCAGTPCDRMTPIRLTTASFVEAS